jgi:glutathione synthase/RimK-type ligase-like ATP-grasp enzyme
MSILIFNPMNDFHCDYLIYKLKKRNISFIELGPVHSNEYTFRNNTLIYNGKIIDNVQAIYVRSNMIFKPQTLETSYLDTYNEQIQFKSQVENLFSWLKIMNLNGVRILNPPIDNSKYLQLYKLINKGLPIPSTCITNSYNELIQFIESTGSIVCKPLMGGYYCRKVDEDYLKNIKYSCHEPVIYQEYIEGLDVRVYVLNGEVLSAHELEKQTTNLSIDYRVDPSFSNGKINYNIIDLPPNIKNVCIEATKILGLEFAGIDLKLNNQGDYYLLECNSMPVYLDLEFKNGVKITDHIIDYLNYHSINQNVSFEEVSYNKKNNNSNKKSLFDYKKIYEKFYHQSNGKNLVILPVNSEQQKMIKNYNENIIEEGCVIVSVD